ncbi:hypothetical protein GCM10010171_01590 [Actinokineospora fastidiosa]|uniref:DUF6896 domain-containing protein n=1 Tax=Actinokineospora fastidiosa TaxID=1816 RepID=A0A918G1G2_9PSEU|nr:hypothetical protein GCM10010171_01590 [Actinokineospora fastidiosa]
MQPAEEIADYLAALRRVDERVSREHDSLAAFVGLHRTREIPRSGQVGDLTYQMHGAGCRFIEPNGGEVDIDLVDDRATFDPWRIRSRTASTGTTPASTLADLSSACAESAAAGLLVSVREGWFASPG